MNHDTFNLTKGSEVYTKATTPELSTEFPCTTATVPPVVDRNADQSTLESETNHHTNTTVTEDDKNGTAYVYPPLYASDEDIQLQQGYTINNDILKMFAQPEEDLILKFKDSVSYCFNQTDGGYAVAASTISDFNTMFFNSVYFNKFFEPIMKFSSLPPTECGRTTVLDLTNVSYRTVNNIMRHVMEKSCFPDQQQDTSGSSTAGNMFRPMTEEEWQSESSINLCRTQQSSTYPQDEDRNYDGSVPVEIFNRSPAPGKAKSPTAVNTLTRLKKYCKLKNASHSPGEVRNTTRKAPLSLSNLTPINNSCISTSVTSQQNPHPTSSLESNNVFPSDQNSMCVNEGMIPFRYPIHHHNAYQGVHIPYGALPVHPASHNDMYPHNPFLPIFPVHPMIVRPEYVSDTEPLFLDYDLSTQAQQIPPSIRYYPYYQHHSQTYIPPHFNPATAQESHLPQDLSTRTSSISVQNVNTAQSSRSPKCTDTSADNSAHGAKKKRYHGPSKKVNIEKTN